MHADQIRKTRIERIWLYKLHDEKKIYIGITLKISVDIVLLYTYNFDKKCEANISGNKDVIWMIRGILRSRLI